MEVLFEIHFEDLIPITQHYFCEKFKTTPKEELQNINPLAILSRELKEEKEKA